MAEFRLVLTALALLCAMFLAGVHGIRHRIGVVILGLLSISWFTIDKLFEGDVIIELDTRMGFTTTDIIGVLGLLVTAALAWRWISRRPDPEPLARPDHDEVAQSR